MTAGQEMRAPGGNLADADQNNYSVEIVGDSADGGKTVVSTLAADFEALGYSLHELSDGSFLACRWGYSRPLQSRYEAQRFYRQIGGRE